MSTLKVDGIRSNSATSDAITLASNGTCTANITNNLSNRNKIINGEFKFWQRGTSHTGIAIDQYTTDRWKSVSFTGNESGRMTVSQSTDTPDGFQYSMKLDCTTADGSPASGDAICMAQRIEANDIYDVGFGTSGAKKITVSLYAKAVNRTGKYSVSLMNQGSSATNVNCQEIDVTTSWQRFTLSFIADSSLVTTTTGTNSGCQLLIGLYSGTKSISSFNAWNTYNTGNIFSTNQVNFFDNTSNELYITGVQLEVGSTATDFEHRSYGDELLKCQRYYEHSYNTGIAVGANSNVGGYYENLTSDNGNNAPFSIEYKVQKRAVPSLAFYADDGTANQWSYGRNGANGQTSVTGHRNSQTHCNGYIGVGAAWVACYAAGHWTSSSEL